MGSEGSEHLSLDPPFALPLRTVQSFALYRIRARSYAGWFVLSISLRASVRFRCPHYRIDAETGRGKCFGITGERIDLSCPRPECDKKCVGLVKPGEAARENAI